MGTQSRACAKGAFRIYQYQPGVHQENLKNIHDDLQQRAGAFYVWTRIFTDADADLRNACVGRVHEMSTPDCLQHVCTCASHMHMSDAVK